MLIISGALLLIKCTNDVAHKTEVTNNDNFKAYAGSASCANCHKDIYNTHLHTEHFLSSAPATEKNIAGSFERGKNKYVFNPSNAVIMEKRDSGLYQVEYINGEQEKTGRFDITIGSGRKGQSYLSWISNYLVQLPITYFAPTSTWSNSPGFPRERPRFYRPITSRCLECHSTYVQKISAPTAPREQFDHDNIIYGIDCEKCHGPAAEHVQFQTQNPEVKPGKYIVNPGKLSRQQNLDLCGLCHGGAMSKTRPSFQFQAGDTLTNYFILNPNPIDAASIDVHGNQLGMLSVSKCFISSQMTCTSCHNTHENQKDKVALFSEKCQACHSEGHGKLCKKSASLGSAITTNCIDCHMPKQPSRSIAVNLQGSDTLTPVLMRTHVIKVYPDETKKVLGYLKRTGSTK